MPQKETQRLRNLGKFDSRWKPTTNRIGKNDGPDTPLGNQLMLVTRGFIRSLAEYGTCGSEFVRKKTGSGYCDRPLMVTKNGSMGFASGFDVECSSRNEDHKKPQLWTSARIGGREQYIINMSIVINTMLEGNGFEGMNRLTSGMGLGCITKSSYQTMRDKVYLALNELAEESRRREAQFAVEHFGIDLRIVFDGSWGKRMGDNSTTALMQCMTPETNKIIGTCVVSKVCNMWKFHQTKNTKQITQEHECAKNWDGASPGMEQYGIECIVKKLLFEEDIRVNEIVQMDGNFARAICHLTWKNRVTDPMSKPDAVNFAANLATCIWNKGHQATLSDLFDRVHLDLPMERLGYAVEDDNHRFLPVHLKAVKRREEAKKALKVLSSRKSAYLDLPPPLPVAAKKRGFQKKVCTKQIERGVSINSMDDAEFDSELAEPCPSRRGRGRPRKGFAGSKQSNGSQNGASSAGRDDGDLGGQSDINDDDQSDGNQDDDDEEVVWLSAPERFKEGMGGRIRLRPRIDYTYKSTKPVVAPKPPRPVKAKKAAKAAKQTERSREAQFQAELRREMAQLQQSGRGSSPHSSGQRSSAREKRALNRSEGRPPAPPAKKQKVQRSSGNSLPVKKNPRFTDALTDSGPGSSSSFSLLDQVGLVPIGEADGYHAEFDDQNGTSPLLTSNDVKPDVSELTSQDGGFANGNSGSNLAELVASDELDFDQDTHLPVASPDATSS